MSSYSLIAEARKANAVTTLDMADFTYVAVPARLVTDRDPWLALVPMFSIYLDGGVYVLKAPLGWRP